MTNEEPKCLGAFSAYEAMAGAYSKKNEDGAFNACFERPSILALLPDVRNLKILDLGSGPGGLTSELVRLGGQVTAVDGSAAMLAASKDRIGKNVEFIQLDLDKGLPSLKDAAFDLVVSSLTIHYIADLTMLAGEISRVLSPGGSLAFSTHHPVMDFPLSPNGEYFRIEPIVDTWEIGGRSFEVKFFRRPLSAIIQNFLNMGFVLEKVSEGIITEELERRFPDECERISKKPYFIFFRFRKS